MRILFEGQPLCSNFKTGIGIYAYNIIKRVIDIYKEGLFEISVFDFFSIKGNRSKILQIFDGTQNLSIKAFNFLPYTVYSGYQDLFRIFPYNYLFNTKADVSHFFNFFIPNNIKSKTIVTVYDMVYKFYPETMNKKNYKILDKNLQRSCRDADLILTISENSRKEIVEFMDVPHDKIRIVYPAADIDIFYSREETHTKNILKNKYNLDSDYILYLGALEPRKNITTLINAFKIVSERNRYINLVISGPRGWLYEDIFKLVKDLNIEDRVIFTGYVAEEDKPAIYAGALAFVFPSFYEGFGIPPLEAMACGTPVIVSNTSSLPEVVGDAGILINPMDIESLAFEIDRLINDQALRKNYIEKGLERAENFSWDDSAKKVVDIYRSLE